MMAKPLIQSSIEDWADKYKQSTYEYRMEYLKLHFTNQWIEEVCADHLHEMFGNNGDERINGIILLNLERQGFLKKRHYIKSKRKEINHGRPIMLYEVISNKEKRNRSV